MITRQAYSTFQIKKSENGDHFYLIPQRKQTPKKKKITFKTCF